MATTKFKFGDEVRCQRDIPARGTWKNYNGRVGRVVVADNYGEVGVRFGSVNTNNEHITWFLPSELRHEGGIEGAHNALGASQTLELT